MLNEYLHSNILSGYITNTQSNTQDSSKPNPETLKSYKIGVQKSPNMKTKPNFWFLHSSTIFFFITLVQLTRTMQRKCRNCKIHNVIEISQEYFLLALIFDPFTQRVYHPESESGSPDTSPQYPYAVACPAQNEDEEKLNTIDHKALFVQNYYEDDYTFSGQIEDCKTSIQLTAVFFRGSKFDRIDFGYEVSATPLKTIANWQELNIPT